MKISALFSTTALVVVASPALAADYYATPAVETLSGTAAADNFIVNRAAYIAGDTYDGGGGIDTLWITKTMMNIDFPALNFNFSNAAIRNMEVLAFNYMLMEMPGNVIFTSAQFGPGLLPNNLAIYGAWGDQDIAVNLVAGNSSFDASGWVFKTDMIPYGAVWGPYYYQGIGEVGGIDTIHLNGSAGNNNIVGTSQDDFIAGNAGDDIIEGGPGKDSINGGPGDDTASYFHAPSAVAVNLALATAQNTGGAGVDTLIQIENLIGSSFNDTLLGNAAANVIEGGPGNDTIDGKAGLDTASYERATAAVFVNLALSGPQNTGGAGVDTLLGIENLRGSAFNDTLVGNNLANVIEGGPGNDTINGGAGFDTASYEHAPAAVLVGLSVTTAQNTRGAGFDTLTGIEGLLGSAFNDKLFGNNGANVIEGGPGDDYIHGGGGPDTASYEHATAGVVVGLGSTAAQNTRGAGVDTLVAIENLRGSAFNDKLFGNAAANVIEGGPGNDYMNGGGGVDTASYANAPAGVTVNLSLAGAQNTVGAGVDTLVGFENLTGSAFNDTLTGDGNANIIEGGLGKDTMNGGLGRDTFVFTRAIESAVGANRDVITDFVSGVDKIDLWRIDANFTQAGDQAFTFIGAAPFGKKAGELRFANGVLAGDITGDGVADFEIGLTGVASFNPATDLTP